MSSARNEIATPVPVLIDRHHPISENELRTPLVTRVIQDILAGRLQAPNVHPLKSMTYQGEKVYRAKLNNKDRLIFTNVDYQGGKALLLLSLITDHNYDKLRRVLDNWDNRVWQETSFTNTETKEVVSENANETLSFEVVEQYKNLYLHFDPEQESALSKAMPLILTGPPGSGKSAVLSSLMKQCIAQLAEDKEEHTVMFVSPALHLLGEFSKSSIANAIPAQIKVTFSSWLDILADAFPELGAVHEKEFSEWLPKRPKKEKFNCTPLQLHYDLSLLKALGPDQYNKLVGKRECYITDAKQKTDLVRLLAAWEDYLKTSRLFDPMVSLPTIPEITATVFCDESQNLPPIALFYLIKCSSKAGRIVASLDSEQSLLTSPYIQHGLTCLMEANIDAKYQKHFLSKTWRCAPGVTACAINLMHQKHRMTEQQYRREYSEVKSALPSGGLVSLITTTDEKKTLQQYGNLPTTVIIVPSQPKDRANLEDTYQCKNIMTADQAIGLDFEIAIVLNFINETCIRKIDPNVKLTLEQEQQLNGWYIAITRAKTSVFIVEPKNLETKVKLFLGDSVLLNKADVVVKELTPEERKANWTKQVDHHLASQTPEGIQLARTLMRDELKMEEDAIESKIAAATAAANKRYVKNPIVEKKKVKQNLVTPKKPITQVISSEEKILNNSKVDNPPILQQPISQFFKLVSTRSHELLLSGFSLENPLPKACTPETLFYAEGIHSAFSLLCVTLAGRLILTSIFIGSQSKEFIESEKLASALCANIPNTNFSALHYLSNYIEGSKIIYFILTRRPEILANQEFVKTFLVSSGNASHKYLEIMATQEFVNALFTREHTIHQESLLYSLCTIKKGGHEFLRAFLNHFPAELITTEEFSQALCAPIKYDDDDISSALLNLLKGDNVDGFNLFLEILKKWPDIIASKEFATALCTLTAKNDSVFFRLCLAGYKIQTQILTSILEKQPHLIASEEFITVLYARLQEQDLAKNTLYGDDPSALDVLCCRSNISEFLLGILKKYPAILASKKFAEALLTVKKNNSSPLYSLCSDQGHDILRIILTGSDIPKSKEFAIALCALISNKVSGLRILMQSDAGSQILFDILRICPAIIKYSEFATALFAGNASAINKLSHSEMGREILQYIFDQHPDIVSSDAASKTAFTTLAAIHNICEKEKALADQTNKAPLSMLFTTPQQVKVITTEVKTMESSPSNINKNSP